MKLYPCARPMVRRVRIAEGKHDGEQRREKDKVYMYMCVRMPYICICARARKKKPIDFLRTLRVNLQVKVLLAFEMFLVVLRLFVNSAIVFKHKSKNKSRPTGATRMAKELSGGRHNGDSNPRREVMKWTAAPPA